MQAVCLHLGNLINQTELGRDNGVSQPTVEGNILHRPKTMTTTPGTSPSGTGVPTAPRGERRP
jgi:hypothetical protein